MFWLKWSLSLIHGTGRARLFKHITYAATRMSDLWPGRHEENSVNIWKVSNTPTRESSPLCVVPQRGFISTLECLSTHSYTTNLLYYHERVLEVGFCNELKTFRWEESVVKSGDLQVHFKENLLLCRGGGDSLKREASYLMDTVFGRWLFNDF